MFTDSDLRSRTRPAAAGQSHGPLRIAGLASHRGTNLRHIDAACKEEGVNAELSLLISNNSAAPILRYARINSIPWMHLSGVTHSGPGALDRAICDALVAHDIDLVFLSGYMKRLGPMTVDSFRGHILNVHPALLPAYGGQGMYGDYVYQAVLAAGERKTGATIHLVDEEYDHGQPVRKFEVPVKPTDDVAKLKNRVLRAERLLCIETISDLAAGCLDLKSLAPTGPLVGAGT